jgi:hypothetical protein
MPPGNAPATRATLRERVASAYFACCLALSQQLGRPRAPSAEPAAGVLTGLDDRTALRIAVLTERYGVRFEARRSQPTALQNYACLDVLDQAYAAWGLQPAPVTTMHDVGSASFGYAAALQAYFRPAHLVGVEIEGFRRLQGGIYRQQRALGLIADLEGVEFVVGDYRRYAGHADLVTAFYPFVTVTPVLAWRMPLSVLDPAALFARIRANLEPAGTLLMVNHSAAEAEVAGSYARAAGLTREHEYHCAATLEPRPQPPVVSRWCGARGQAGRARGQGWDWT